MARTVRSFMMCCLAETHPVAPNDFEFTGRRRRSGAMKGWAARPALTLGRGPEDYACLERRPFPRCLAARSRKRRDMTCRAPRRSCLRVGLDTLSDGLTAALRRGARQPDSPSRRAVLACTATRAAPTGPACPPAEPPRSYSSGVRLTRFGGHERCPTSPTITHEPPAYGAARVEPFDCRPTISNSPAAAGGPVR